MNNIKNGDCPASPLGEAAYIDFENAVNRNGGYNPECQGLTKREAFAMAAMQGMISSKYSGEYMSEINDVAYDKPSGLANNAIRYADALLKELSK